MMDSATSNGGAAFTTTFNGGVCTICTRTYLGSHRCAIEDLLARAEQLRQMAVQRFEELGPKLTRGPIREDDEMTSEEFDEAFAKGTPATIKTDGPITARITGCPCRPENGGSGVCGCTLGGPQVTS